MRPRRQRPLFIIDIALPRDVEASVGDLDQVFLYNIDDLQGIVKENLDAALARSSSAPKRSSTRRSRGSRRGCSRARSFPTVVALRERFESIRQAELARLEPKLAGLPPEARGPASTRSPSCIVEKLLLTPTEQLKSVRDDGSSRPIRTRSTACSRSGRRTSAASRRARKARVSPLRRDATDALAAANRHARQPARAVAGAGGGDATRSRTASPSSWSSSRRRAIGCSPRRCRRLAASACSSRRSRTRCCAGDDRRRRAQRQGHAGGCCPTA